MLLFWVVFTALGLFDPYFFDQSNAQAYYLLSVLISTVFMYQWFLADIHDNHFQVGRGMKVLVLFLGVFVLLIYVFKYKGWKRACRSLGTFVLFFIIYCGVLILQEYYLYDNVL